MDHRITIAGAGSIGCFVGGLAALGGNRVTLLGRPTLVDTVATKGLTLTSFEGCSEAISSSDVAVTADPQAAFADASLILVTVKSGQTEEMGRLIATHAPETAVVVSLQNGLDNAARLRAVLPGRRIHAGMVSFNVLGRGDGVFHRGTSGPVVIEDVGGECPLFVAPHLDLVCHPRMDEVLAGKLLYNLNNALNALSGLTLAEQLADRRWRKLFAAAQDEALAVFRAEGLAPWSMSKIPVTRMPRMLRLPNFLFRQVAKRGVRIDRTARSSMWEDLERRRPTEIGDLQGAIIRRGEKLGIATPVNRVIADAIRAAEQAGAGSPGLSPDVLLSRVS
ncbi:2-dehydropantoate 2-reductase [Sphingomonas rosea]|uniref:2-dehydropantoate 2-reductase n=1 Tax=Sphingomonas rosea TaxID=335605 RepID=A0ABP7TR16_9SPHN